MKQKTPKLMLESKDTAMEVVGAPFPDSESSSIPELSLPEIERLSPGNQLRALRRLSIAEILEARISSPTLKNVIDSNSSEIMRSLLHRAFSGAGRAILEAVLEKLAQMPVQTAWQTVHNLLTMKPSDGVNIRSVFEEHVFGNLLWASFPEAVGRLIHDAYPLFELDEATEYASNLKSWYTRPNGSLMRHELWRAVETAINSMTQTRADPRAGRIIFTYPSLPASTRISNMVTISSLLASGGYARSLSNYLLALPQSMTTPDLQADTRLAVKTLPAHKMSDLVDVIVQTWKVNGNRRKLNMIANQMLKIDPGTADKLISHFALDILQVMTAHAQKKLRAYVMNTYTAARAKQPTQKK